MTGTLAS